MLESAHGSLGSACDQGERAAGGNPISHVQVVSGRRVCSVQGRLSACVCACVRLREVSLDKQAS